LDFDDQLGILQLLGQAGIYGQKFAVLLDQWADNDLGAALLSRESVELALLALLSPGAQVRRVEALAAQQETNRSGVASRIGLLNDRQLILGGETTTMRSGDHF